MHATLLETLRLAQRLGFFGEAPIESAYRHASAFVEAAPLLPPGARVIDLGSGGGLPGLVLAEAWPTVSVRLLDRRAKRTDFLERAVRRLGFEHVTVVTDDVRNEIDRVHSGESEPYDLVTARGFGPPGLTLRCAAQLCAPAGSILISEPPAHDRWPRELVAELGLQIGPPGRVRRFDRVG